jgi:hypothetical protein
MNTLNNPLKPTISVSALRKYGFLFLNLRYLEVTNPLPFSYNGKPAKLMPQNIYRVYLPMQRTDYTKLPNLFEML